MANEPGKEEQQNPIGSMAVEDSHDPASSKSYGSETTRIPVKHAAISHRSPSSMVLPTDVVH